MAELKYDKDGRLLFTKEMKEEYTILMPQMLPVHFVMFRQLLVLDGQNNGWIMNAMHSREGCYTYVKEIVKAESYVELAEEEAEALDKAIFSDVYEKQ